MKKKLQILSLLLCCAIVLSLVAVGMPARAAEEGGTGAQSGMVIDKTATDNGDGTYTIRLEAYATGEKIISEVKKDVPADIILVLDQSGSMQYSMNTTSFRPYDDRSNSNYYKYRHNGSEDNLWYEVDGTYYAVSVTMEIVGSYTQITSYRNNSTNNNKATNLWNNRNNLYVKVGDQYNKVDVSRYDYFIDRTYTYKYIGRNGSETITSQSDTGTPSFRNVDGVYLAQIDETKTVYTYTYTDSKNVTHTIGESIGANTNSGLTLYEEYNVSSVTRLEALKTAVSSFADSIAQKAKGADGQFGTADDVNHRVAVVGFASGEKSDWYNPAYENTELFIGATQYNYNENASAYYGSAFQDMDTEQGYNNVVASTNALAGRGGTYTNLGIEMANGILKANPVEAGTKRNRVIVVFTDGEPAWTEYDPDIAKNAVDQATAAKNQGITVYSVGIFDGADASANGISNENSSQRANQFMQDISSNNGTPQNPSYYLSAADSATLNSIFQQISDQIEEGGSSATLTEAAVIKDIIAPSFQLPVGSTADAIKLETYACTGVGNDGKYTWQKNTDAMGANATIAGDQVSVTGFNFMDNWVGKETNGSDETYRGNKLVISFDVETKEGFLGGNQVPTNDYAGVYEDKNAIEPVVKFPVPDVDVKIDDVTVDTVDKNVYLLGDLTAEQIKSGTTVSVGDVPLNLSPSVNNYGLEEWQNDYVNISVTYKDANDNVIEDLTNLTVDTTYTVVVTVSPKNEGNATAQSGSDKGNINVFKPVLTYNDTDVYYGDNAPTSLAENLESIGWFHNNVAANKDNMFGEEPVLAIEYDYVNQTDVVEGKVNTKNDIPVDVTAVKILDTDVKNYVTFAHKDCVTDENLPSGKFLLHVKTCELTITKTGEVENDPFVFTVMKDGVKYTEATIVGNKSVTIKELPVGTYTIEEDAGWSWRYIGKTDDGVTLSSEKPTGEATCTNNKNNNFWLNGFSQVVTNIFGTPKK